MELSSIWLQIMGVVVVDPHIRDTEDNTCEIECYTNSDNTNPNGTVQRDESHGVDNV